MADLSFVAESLIKAVDGIVTEKNIEGVLEVFEGIRKGVNNQWEEHLAAESTEAIMYDEILCACGSLIDVKRTRLSVDVKVKQ